MSFMSFIFAITLFERTLGEKKKLIQQWPLFEEFLITNFYATTEKKEWKYEGYLQAIFSFGFIHSMNEGRERASERESKSEEKWGRKCFSWGICYGEQ